MSGWPPTSCAVARDGRWSRSCSTTTRTFRPAHTSRRVVWLRRSHSKKAVLREAAEERTPHPIRRFPRHTTFFELEVDGDAEVPDVWDHRVTGAGRDNGMTFHCRFEPLPLAFPLADGQDAWLDRLEA